MRLTSGMCQTEMWQLSVIFCVRVWICHVGAPERIRRREVDWDCRYFSSVQEAAHIVRRTDQEYSGSIAGDERPFREIERSPQLYTFDGFCLASDTAAEPYHHVMARHLPKFPPGLKLASASVLPGLSGPFRHGSGLTVPLRRLSSCSSILCPGRMLLSTRGTLRRSRATYDRRSRPRHMP